MTKSALSIAAALFAATTLFGSGAQACISCEYVPEVVNTPVRGAKTFQKKRVTTASVERSARPAQKRVSAQPAPKKVEVAKAEPAEAVPARATNAPTEARLLSGAPAAPAEAEKPAETSAKDTKDTKVADLGCKRFIPTAGVTVTVPCE